MIRDLTPEERKELVEAMGSARHPIPLEKEKQTELAEYARLRELMRGDIVMHQGDPPDWLYFVLSGQLRAADTSGDQPRLLSYHAVGAFVGEQGLLYNQARTATVDVISDAKLAYWDRATFDWLLSQDDRVRPYFEELYRHRERRARRPFPGKQWDEVVLVRSHKHALVLLGALIGPVFLFLVSLTLLILALVFGDEISSVVIGAVVGLPMLISLLWGGYNYADWVDDEYIVTSKRVIHIERYVFYGEERDEAPLIRIQDVTVVARTWLQRLLDYHDLIIQTAGAGNIVFSGVTDVEQVKEEIFAERAKALERREAGDKARIRKSLAQKVGTDIPDVQLPVDTLAPTTGVFAERRARRLPKLLDYLRPRMWIVEGDTVIWRKHWIVLMGRTWPALILTLIFLALMIPALLRLGPFDELAQNSWVLAIALGMGSVVSFGWYIYRYDDWHKDVYIVTRDRIIDVESSAFRLRGEKQRSGTFDVIQNITYAIPGFFHKLLNMGDVTIETAGTAETFTFHEVFDPSAIQQEIFNRMVAYQETRRERDQFREDTRMAEWFGEYHHLGVIENEEGRE